jgi:hypothetical protein
MWERVRDLHPCSDKKKDMFIPTLYHPLKNLSLSITEIHRAI